MRFTYRVERMDIAGWRLVTACSTVGEALAKVGELQSEYPGMRYRVTVNTKEREIIFETGR